VAIPKVMGIETEYGIITRGVEDHNPILASSVLINSFGSPRLRKVRWDYEEESPLRDARGFERPSLEPLEDEGGLVSVILDNGARYYVDHAHPEYSTPECTNARDLVIHDKAGERVLAESIRASWRVMQPNQSILVYKNNSDGKGNSYGCHENYLMSRATPFPMIVRYLTPFLVTRQIFTGSGKVGSEGINARHNVAFQLSQRADFFEVEVGLETTFKRPIINTRDEPHADPEKYRRLHVIVGDANMSEISTYLKVGTMAIVLSMVEDDFIDVDLSIDGPVLAYRKVSRDLACREPIRLRDGRTVTAVDVQREFLGLAQRYYRDREQPPWVGDVLARWESTLDRLARDPMQLARELDWVIKRELIENYMAKHGLNWSDSRVAMIDLQYHDIRPGKGLYYKLEESDAVERIVTDDEIAKAMYDPPKDTRAYFRGMCLQRYADEIASASWDSVIFDLKEGPLKKIFMLEPLRGTEAHVRQLLTDSPSAADLLRNISRPNYGV